MHAICFSRSGVTAPPAVTPPDPPPFSGNTIYMAPAASNGLDTHDGSIGSPVFSFTKAASLMSPGDRCFLRGGQFLISSKITGFTGGTSWNATKLFQAYPGETPTMKFQASVGVNAAEFIGVNMKYVEFDGIKWDYTVTAATTNVVKVTYSANPSDAASYLRFRNCDFTNANQSGQGLLLTDGSVGCELIRSRLHHCGDLGNNLAHGCYWNGADGLIEYCEFDNNGANGIQIYHSVANDVNNTTIRYSKAHHNGTDGILIGTGTGSKGYGCLSYNNTGNGFTIFNGTTNGAFYFCTSYGNTQYGLYIWNGAGNSTIRNFGSYGNGSNYSNNNGTTVQDHNALTTPGTDPHFQAPGSANFHLQSDSAWRGGGVTVSGITVDYDGVPMNSPPDIGAFQYV